MADSERVGKMEQALARWIEDLMRRRQWTQAELSRVSRVPEGLLSRYRRGLSTPSPRYCRMLAAAAGVPAEDVLRLAGYLRRPGDVKPMTAPDELREIRRVMLVQLRRLSEVERRVQGAERDRQPV